MPKTINLGWGLSRSHLRSNFRVFGLLVFAAFMLAFNGAHAQTTNYVLGTTHLLVGPAAGTNSVVLGVTPATGTWTATANTNWLHLSLANQSGTGSTNVIFSYDANPGSTRSGTLTIGNQTLTVTQAGSTYVAAGELTALIAITFPGGSGQDQGLAVDGVGNIYFSDVNSDWVKEWSSINNTVTQLAQIGLNEPKGLAVDGVGNVYIADTVHGAIKEWTAENSNVITLVSSGLDDPNGVAVDGAGNVYIADPFNSAIKEWTPVNDSVTTLVSANVLDSADGVAVDAAGNIYIAVWNSGATYKWSEANSNFTTVTPSNPQGTADAVAVDGEGNLYIADSQTHTIKKWTAASSNMTAFVSSGLGPHLPYYLPDGPKGVAVDGEENVYILDTCNNAIKELPYTFVDPTPRLETPAAGNDVLPAVLPATENLLPPFAPGSDQAWLTITGITNGVVSFSFTANTGSARTAHISLLGQSIPITQGIIGTSPTMTDAQILGDGVVQFVFSNNPSASFTVLSSTNLSLPLGDWTVVGTASNTAPGVFQFTSAPTTNDAQRFYSVRSP